MLTFLVSILLVHGETNTYISFSSTSNPNSEPLPFVIDSVIDLFNQDYTVEFWLRPSSTVVSEVTVLEDQNDWVFKWSPNILTLSDKDSNPLRTYCTFNNVSPTWTHIAITMPSSNPRFFTCYKNGSISDVSMTEEETDVRQYPKTVNVGGDFRGNIADLRVWDDERTQSEIQEFYIRYFEEPTPSGMKRYWRLVDPDDVNEIEDLVGNNNVDIPDTWGIDSLWVEETIDAFQCKTNEYFLSGNCASCQALCQECDGPTLSDCSLTTYALLKITDTPIDGLAFDVNAPANTFEFYMMPRSWTLPNQQVMDFNPVLKVQRNNETSSLSFLYGTTEKYVLQTIQLNQWTHIAFTRSQTIGNIYINGILVFSGEWSETIEDLGTVNIGGPEELAFDGFLTELRIWSTTRTQSEIQENLEFRFESPYSSDLLSYWRLDESDAAFITDLVSDEFISSSVSDMWTFLNCQIEQCLVLCEEGQYLDSTSACSDCDITCKTCSGSSTTQCLSCADEYPLQVENSNICYETCPTGYKQFENSCVLTCPENSFLETDTLCTVCDDTCKTCDGPTDSDCIECAVVNVEGKCEDSCPEQFFQQGTVCIACDPSCQTCSGSANTDCETCLNDFYKTDDTAICVETCDSQYLVIESLKLCVLTCPSGFFENSSSCEPCSEECAECEGGSSVCTQCSDGKFLNANDCVDSCPPNYVGINNECFQCDPGCLECTGVTSADCESCNASFFLDIDSGTCVSSCPVASYVLGANCYSTCPDGYFNVLSPTRTCQLCNSLCLTCTDSTSDDCLSCADGLFFLTNTCLGTCPQGFFANDELNECIQCDTLCEECTGSALEDCQKCNDGLFLLQNAEVTDCVSECGDTAYPEDTDCINCDTVNCLTCESASNCFSCTENFYLSSSIAGKCVGTCEAGEIQYAAQTQCIPYTSRFPEGSVKLSEMTRISLEFDIPLKKGSGVIIVYNSNGSVLLSLSTDNTGVLAIDNLFTVAVSSESFLYGATYTIEIPETAVLAEDGSAMNKIPSSSWSFSVEPYTLKPLVAIINDGLKAVEITQFSNYTLDASESYDPSSLLAPGELQYIWSCENFTTDYANFIANKGSSWATYVNEVQDTDSNGFCTNWEYPTSTVYNMTQNFYINNVLRFEFTILDTNNRQSTAAIFVRTVSESVPVLRIENTPQFKVNTNRPLLLKSADNYIGLTSALTWEYSPDDAKILTPLTGTWYLTIAEDGLTPGTSYTFSLTYADFNYKTSSVIQIETNTAPSNGVLFLDPSSGVALTSIITGQMFSWTDEDLPLRYSFTYAIGDYTVPSFEDLTNGALVAEYPITGEQSQSNFITYFPRGLITVIGYCYDSLGASSFTTAQITLAGQTDTANINEAANLILYEIDEENAIPNLSSASAVAFELFFGGFDISETQLIKERLISAVSDVINFADSITDEGIAASMYYSSLLVLEPVSRDPITETQTGTVLDLANSIDVNKLLAFQTVTFSESDLVGESTQITLSTKDLYNVAGIMYDTAINVGGQSFKFVFTNQINELVTKADEVLKLNTQTTENPRTITKTNSSIYSQKQLTSVLRDSVVTIDSTHSLEIIDISELEREVDLSASVIRSNPFNGTDYSLDEYVSVTVTDLSTSERITELYQPIIFTYSVSRVDIVAVQQEISNIRGASASIWPQCVFWNTTLEEWSTDGCTLQNIGDIYNYFELDTPTTFTNTIEFVCSCTHLTDFSISFEITNEANFASTIIKSEYIRGFEDWEVSIVFYFLLILILVFIALMIWSMVWDNSHEGLKNPSIMTERYYGYCDTSKVNRVLAQLEKEFLQASLGETDPASFMFKLSNSAFLSKIAKNKPKKLIPSSVPDSIEDEYPVEAIMARVRGDSSSVFDEPHILEPNSSPRFDDSGALTRIKAYLKRGDNRMYKPMMPQEENLQRSIHKLDNHLENLETGSVPSEVDAFIDQFQKDPKFEKKLKAKQMTYGDLKAIGMSPYEFEALKVVGPGFLEPDSYELTEGRYCEKVLDNVKHFHYSVELRYWNLVLLYIKKEHKVLALFFNLHVEFTKKQMVCILFMYNFFQLILCQLYIEFIDWQFTERNTSSGRCEWGCAHEAQVLAGFGIAFLCWPIMFFTKYLFASNMVKYNSEKVFIEQAAFNKRCKEIIGILWVLLPATIITIVSIELMVFMPFDKDQALHFVYCYCASLVWSLLLGEIFGALFKAYCVWMAQANRPGKNNCLYAFTYWLLTYFPCVIFM